MSPRTAQPSAQAAGLRLQTLILLRWVAIAGQVAAIVIAARFFGVEINLGLASAVIGLAVLLNVIVTFVFPANMRLDTPAATWMLVFDTLQLASMLLIAGGLTNPFAVLLIAPVTVAASALGLRATVLVGLTAALATTLLAWVHLPLVLRDGTVLELPQLYLMGFWLAMLVGIAFAGAYTQRISAETREMSDALLATQLALAREQKLTDLGGVVAATAHELGTPLATITLAAAELADELESQPDLAQDARLIREQADRCRDILRSMGRAGKDDSHLHTAPLGHVVEEAAEPHQNRGKRIVIKVGDPDHDPARQPIVHRRPELIHGLRNLIQNAVDFAATTVWVEVCWTDKAMSVRITDDGPGYPPHLIGHIGEPFLGRRKKHGTPQRAHYEGMGLGLFIAKTLLERTGAELSFANATEPWTGQTTPGQKAGAIAAVVWRRGEEALEANDRRPAPNRPFDL